MDIETQSPGTIKRMAEAACGERAKALNNIANTLGLLSNYELNKIEAEDGGTLECIAEAATSGHPTALNNIAATLGLLSNKVCHRLIK